MSSASTPAPSLASVQALFQQGGSSVKLDPASSSVIIGNLNASVMPLLARSPFVPAEEETDDFRIVVFVFDRSWSMTPVRDLVLEGFNDIVIPGLLGGAASQVGAIRVGGLSFGGGGLKPMWQGGMHPLAGLPALDASNYVPRGGTPMLDGIVAGVAMATKEAMEIRAKTGTPPEVVLAVFGDGAENSSDMVTRLNGDLDKANEEVRKMLTGLSAELFTTVFIGFETDEPVDFTAIANGLGFREVLDSKPKAGESKEEQRRRFRHLMGVFSQSLNTRVSASRAGAPPSAGPTGFWQQQP